MTSFFDLIGKKTTLNTPKTTKADREALDEQLRSEVVSGPPAPPPLDVNKLLLDALGGMKMDREEDYWFHCSGLTDCSRVFYFNWRFGKPKNKKGQFPVQTRFSLLIGKDVHTILQNLCHDAVEMGLISAFEDEIELKSDKDHLCGSCDGKVTTLEGHEYLMEFKTTNNKYYQEFFDKPKKDHVLQLQMYMYMSGVKDGYVVYFNKDTNSLNSHRVRSSEKYQGKVLEKLHHISAAMQKQVPPSKFLKCEINEDGTLNTDKLNKNCPNYTRCKAYELKGEQPLPIRA